MLTTSANVMDPWLPATAAERKGGMCSGIGIPGDSLCGGKPGVVRWKGWTTSSAARKERGRARMHAGGGRGVVSSVTSTAPRERLFGCLLGALGRIPWRDESRPTGLHGLARWSRPPWERARAAIHPLCLGHRVPPAAAAAAAVLMEEACCKDACRDDACRDDARSTADGDSLGRSSLVVR